MTSSLSQSETKTANERVSGQTNFFTQLGLSRYAWRVLTFLVLIILVALIWEGAKWIGGNPWRADENPFNITHEPPYRWKVASDLNLPHLWDLVDAFTQPARRNGPPLSSVLIRSAVFTFREAVTGFLLGSFFGLLLGTLLANSSLMERGLMPYVVASQTVPILAIAPNEINSLIWPSPNGIGIMDDELYQQTVDISLGFGVINEEPGDSAFRTDIAQQALDGLSDLDTSGENWTKLDIEVTPGGE